MIYRSILIFLILLFLGCNGNDSMSDPCDDVICENNGTCIDGECDCPPGFSGNSCETELVPQVIIIVGISITEWPALQPDGTIWDEFDNSGPDLELSMTDENAMPIFFSTEIFENAEENTIYAFDDISIQLGNTASTSEYIITLLDVDGTSERTLMGQARGQLYTPGNGLPPVITISDGNLVAFDIELNYIF